ncbi:unnamed protein product [Ilex paraguariensis]|uniref:Uncharacterized protein n=1 Tax=Ilex paraguariensis TaxID=185542 RepID=A0ABC8TUT9_9AQUA
MLTNTYREQEKVIVRSKEGVEQNSLFGHIVMYFQHGFRQIPHKFWSSIQNLIKDISKNNDITRINKQKSQTYTERLLTRQTWLDKNIFLDINKLTNIPMLLPFQPTT